MRTMSALPVESARPMDWSRFSGTSERFMRAILDLNFGGRRSRGFRERGGAKAGSAFLRQLAEIRALEREPAPCPLLWSMRVCAYYRQAAFSFSDLQSLSLDEARRALQAGVASTSIQYRAMASWACRCSVPQFEIGPICLQIRDQVGVGGNYLSVFPLPETSAWLAWFRASRSVDFAIPESSQRTILHHRVRWQELGITRDVTKAMGEAVRESWAFARSGYGERITRPLL